MQCAPFPSIHSVSALTKRSPRRLGPGRPTLLGKPQHNTASNQALGMAGRAVTVLVSMVAVIAGVLVAKWPSIDPQGPYGHPLVPWSNDVPAVEADTGAAIHILQDPAGVQLFVRHWHPQRQAPSAVLVMVHGATWHSKFFTPAAQRFVEENGWAVVALDLPSHGRSGSATGVKACHPTGLPGFAAAVEAVLQHVQQRLHPGTPTFLLGESLGAAVLLTGLLRAGQEQQQGKQVAWQVDGVILSGPVVGVPRHLLPPAPVVKVMQAVAKVAPQLPVPDDNYSNLDLWLLAFGDKDLAKKIWQEDKHIMKHMPICMVSVLLPAFEWLEQHRQELAAPVLILHGDKDVRVLLESSQQLMQQAASTDKTLKLYEGGAHQLFQDQPNITERVMQDIATWVNKRAGVRQPDAAPDLGA